MRSGHASGLWRAAATAAVIMLVLAACTSTSAPHYDATMTVSPRRALLDAAVDVRVGGLPAGSTVRITASATDFEKVSWRSAADFVVPRSGVVTLDQPAKSGSYRGIHPRGLLLYMRPTAKGSDADTFIQPFAGAPVRFTASIAGHQVASGHTFRADQLEGTTVRHLSPASDGVYGDLFTPPHETGLHPAVLLIGGSEGGESPYGAAQLLSAHGYPSMALAYFKEPGLPHELSDIPLEYFARALRILRAEPHVDPKHVVVFGVSRGGEGAMLIASTYPSLVNGVVGGVPGWEVQTSYPGGSGYAWTLHGRRLDVGTPIEVEHIRGPILEACGEDDAIWESCANVDKIGARLTSHHFRYPVTVLRYPDAGHTAGQLNCCVSYTPAGYVRYGGSLVANQRAAVAGHQKLLDFLASLSAGN